MSSVETPTKPLLERWLGEAHVEYYLCDQCEGLHVRALQSLDGVVDSRVFLERYGLLFTTELEIRPMALLPLAADLGRLNMQYPTLKIFLDVVDDATPQLVVSSSLLGGAGVSMEQFVQFVVNAMEGMRQLADDCLHLDYLFQEAGSGRGGASRSVH